MKFSEAWLREWVNPPLSRSELVELLTMSGLEVEGTEPVAPDFSQVVVGEVVAIQAHPNADKLKICQVNIGETEPLTIVCGASNVAVGMRVPTALVGAVLPNDFTIKLSKLRGIASAGMLCSAKELGLAEISEGLLPLPADAPIGQSVREYLQLDDVTIEIKLTPNRGDCAGLAGIAREVGLLTRTPVNYPTITSINPTITDTYAVHLTAPSHCPHYVGRGIRGINARAATPHWMKERLRRAGIRSISAIVDVTNYVMLELNHPLHAFDWQKLNGNIQVRLATPNEPLTLLNNQEIHLDEKTLVIADAQQAVALAGIMGGLPTAVTDETTDIFLECAFFTPQLIAGVARRYGLITDAAYRFERGVNWQGQTQAIERATDLILAIAGGQPAPLTIATETQHLPTTPNITLRHARINALLGQQLEATDIEDILTRLGIKWHKDGAQWQLQPPSFRFDITREEDLIEELARVYGYNRLPCTPPRARLTMLPPPIITLDLLKNTLTQRGYQEAITYSFVDTALQQHLTPALTAIPLANPLARDMATMRTTLWTGLLQAVQYNQKRQQTRIRLFENGLRFIQENETLKQEPVLAGIICGTRYAEQWGTTKEPVDFYDLKSDVETLLSYAGHPAQIHFAPTTHPALHSGQAAAIYLNQQFIGLIGALHPSLFTIFDVDPPIYLFELALSPLCTATPRTAQEISKYPSLRRDIALLIPDTISVDAILTKIKQIGGELLSEICLFDVYQGKGIENGKKSIAIGLIFQAFSRNLVETEIDAIIAKTIQILEQDFQAQQRK